MELVQIYLKHLNNFTIINFLAFFLFFSLNFSLLGPDPEPREKINADPSGSRSTALRKSSYNDDNFFIFIVLSYYYYLLFRQWQWGLYLAPGYGGGPNGDHHHGDHHHHTTPPQVPYILQLNRFHIQTWFPSVVWIRVRCNATRMRIQGVKNRAERNLLSTKTLDRKYQISSLFLMNFHTVVIIFFNVSNFFSHSSLLHFYDKFLAIFTSWIRIRLLACGSGFRRSPLIQIQSTSLVP